MYWHLETQAKLEKVETVKSSGMKFFGSTFQWTGSLLSRLTRVKAGERQTAKLEIHTRCTQPSVKGLRQEPEHVSQGNPHSPKEVQSFISVPFGSVAMTIFTC